MAASGPELWISETLLLLGEVDETWTSASPCREGIAPLERDWNALDAWGRVVGRVRGGVFAGRHGLRLLAGRRGVGVYSTGASFPSAEWRLGPLELGRVRAAIEPEVASAGFATNRKLVFFRGDLISGTAKQSAPAEHFVLVVAGEGLAVLRQTSSEGWTVAYQKLADSSDWPLFEPRAIVDVDRDGTPEVIYHFNEYEDGEGHEVMLRSSDGGASWAEVASNADDCP